ncbi:MAG TPA: polysaccharide biosynthesis tyrosine autokinase [Vicinamibacteria bacterium]|nr:polysaccharide biosynthesis tyrosine autokinase [Vicinamibacteria bacterium]
MLLKECWNILVNRRRLIGGVTLLLFLLSALYSFTRTPLYKTSAVIQISTGGQINLVDDRTIEEARSRYEEFFATQQALLQSRTLAQRVSDQLNLAEHPLFRGKSRGVSDRVASMRITAALLGMLRVAPVAKTQLIEISFIAPERELAAELTNTWAQQYVAYSSQSASGVARTTSDFLRGEIDKLQKSIKEKEAMLLESSRQGDFLLDEQKNVVDQQLLDLTRRLTQVQAERAQAWAHYRSLQQEDAESLPDILNDPAIQGLKRERTDLQRRYAELSSRFKESYPEIQRTRAALEMVEQRLDDAIQEVGSQVIAAAKVTYEAALHEEALLKNDLEQQRQRTRDLNTVTADYRQVKAELDNERAILEQLMMRHSATDLSADLGERQQMMVRVVDDALVPTRRYSPKHRINLGIGAILGLVSGIGLAFLFQGRDPGLVTAEDVRQRVALPYLGFLPRDVSRPGMGPGPASLASSQSAKFLALFLLRPGQRKKTVLVTSSTEGEGKTFVATHLAASLTQLGKKVLLVDANFRSASLRDEFQVGRRAGLSSVLRGTKTLEDCAVPCTELPGLRVMVAGPAAASPANLLGSAAMDAFLKQCADEFDLVVLDSAPLLPVLDSRLLARKCDSVVLVTRSGYSRSDRVEAARESIAGANGRVAGVVLNDVELGDGELVHAEGSEDHPTDPEPSNEHGVLSGLKTTAEKLVDVLHLGMLGPKSRRALVGMLRINPFGLGRRNGHHGASQPGDADGAERDGVNEDLARVSHSSTA